MPDHCPTCGGQVAIVHDPDGPSYFKPIITLPELAAAAIDSEARVIRLEAELAKREEAETDDS